MFKVVYAWTVAPEKAADFEGAWKEMTAAIRATQPGARGSMLLRDEANSRFKAVATWDSREHWERAGQQPSSHPEAGARMQASSTFLSMETFQLVEDMTV